MTAKGWHALGAFDPAERSRALDLLGFDAQLVFSTFAATQFSGDDIELLYGGTRAHNRAMSTFCEADARLLPGRVRAVARRRADARSRRRGDRPWRRRGARAVAPAAPRQGSVASRFRSGLGGPRRRRRAVRVAHRRRGPVDPDASSTTTAIR